MVALLDGGRCHGRRAARPGRRGRRRPALVAVLLLGRVAIAGLVGDGGNALTAKRHAINVAEQAARAGAQALDPASLRTVRPGDGRNREVDEVDSAVPHAPASTCAGDSACAPPRTQTHSRHHDGRRQTMAPADPAE